MAKLTLSRRWLPPMAGLALALPGAVLVLAPRPAHAWETSTHVGKIVLTWA